MTMDGSIFTAIVGLAGAALGGLASFATSWLTQRTQLRERALDADRSRREVLYTEFIKEASRLYGDALGHEKDDVADLVVLYAIIARLRLIASSPVIVTAEAVMRSIIETYGKPNRTLHELRLFAHEGGLEPLLDFSVACREELAQRR